MAIQALHSARGLAAPSSIGTTAPGQAGAAAAAVDGIRLPVCQLCNSSRVSSSARLQHSGATTRCSRSRLNSRCLLPSKARGFEFGSASLFGSVDCLRDDFSALHCKPVTTTSSRRRRGGGAGRCSVALEALIFDCDGVILESEDLHRQAYNLTFEQFSVKCGSEAVVWDTEFYDVLQNTIGGGKPKMRWYFRQNGWPSSTILGVAPESESDQGTLIDTLQDWKTEKYKDLIRTKADPRPGVVELMDEARSKGLKVAVCSAATKSSVVFCLNNLLGKERFERLDCFLAGDDVENKKPDPSIYITAAERLGAKSNQCLVIEDSAIGLQAAVGAGMSCIITYTSSTSSQDFSLAKAIYENLAGISLKELQSLMEAAPITVQKS